jgi:putative hydrolase
VPARPPGTAPAEQPSVAELLAVDREYRQKAEAGRLPRIAPRRFNPTAEAWLPVLHTAVGSRHYTALYSNTARAHGLGTIRDWVVVYRDDQDGRGQWTIVTARFGPLRGRRIVRGREPECVEHYEQVETERRVQADLPVD